MASFKLTHLCLTAVLLSVAFSCCRGQGGGGGSGGGGGGGGGSGIGSVVPGTQDSVQIVAQAALCFDNRPVLNGCLQAMGINASASTLAPTAAGGPTAIMCSAPCFGHMTMMMSCVNGIFGNFQSYNPSLMQGVQAVFQMSCGNMNGQGGGGGGGAGSTSGGGGGTGGTSGGGRGAGGSGTTSGGSTAGGGGGGGDVNGGVGGGSGTSSGVGGTASGGGGASSASGGGGSDTTSSVSGAAAGGGGASGASGGGGSGTTSSVGGATGGGGGAGGSSNRRGDNSDTSNDDGTVNTISIINSTNTSPIEGSHVAVSNPGQQTSTADGRTFSLMGTHSSGLIIWAATWLMLF